MRKTRPGEPGRAGRSKSLRWAAAGRFDGNTARNGPGIAFSLKLTFIAPPAQWSTLKDYIRHFRYVIRIVLHLRRKQCRLVCNKYANARPQKMLQTALKHHRLLHLLIQRLLILRSFGAQS